MTSLLISLTGGSSRGDARNGSPRSPAGVKQLLSRLRCSWRRRAAQPRRSAVRFGYDLHSYYQNFDDGIARA
ncbi:hypothetical protein BDA96_01G239800 [Sorghum bicolor]|uniref:Uncharacterized protein n=2 Tax=Sorghum bicolor TaxID=4558 RepID=A0A921S0A9_SORBI|nr:hypothetical protein SORBI_3001G225300 [Sorghum bicolor]KAG0549258.1 hypothetical protein BDA96_01G239800 [Sorghum bicolor]